MEALQLQLFDCAFEHEEKPGSKLIKQIAELQAAEAAQAGQPAERGRGRPLGGDWGRLTCGEASALQSVCRPGVRVATLSGAN